jgi:hypothetical protein
LQEAAEQEAEVEGNEVGDDLANRAFVKMQQLYPAQFAHSLEAARSEVLEEQLQSAHEMIEHLQQQPTRTAKKATAKRTRTATSGKDKS